MGMLLSKKKRERRFLSAVHQRCVGRGSHSNGWHRSPVIFQTRMERMGWSVSRSLNIPTWWTRERWRTLILVVVNAGRRRTRAIAVSSGAGTTMVMTIKTLSSEVISCTIHSHSLPLYYRAPQASKTAVFLVSELRLELAVKPGVTADKVVAAGAEGVVVTRDIRCGRTSTVLLFFYFLCLILRQYIVFVSGPQPMGITLSFIVCACTT